LAGSPGSTNVLIGNMPAWRVGLDFHTCPLVDPGPKPHVGGMVAMGSTTVMINGAPAARQGDSITEAGPPNTIAVGWATVNIGG
jgi:uncharacterized Zn-binding protein involved in type VI secretion